MYMLHTHIRCSNRPGPMLHEFADYADCVTCVAEGAGDGQQGEVLLVGLVVATLLFHQVRCDVRGLPQRWRGLLRF